MRRFKEYQAQRPVVIADPLRHTTVHVVLRLFLARVATAGGGVEDLNVYTLMLRQGFYLWAQLSRNPDRWPNTSLTLGSVQQGV
jgi:hypothetical protein